jgi:hypothetical protein
VEIVPTECCFPRCHAPVSTIIELPLCDRCCVKVYRRVHAHMVDMSGTATPLLPPTGLRGAAGRPLHSKRTQGLVYYAQLGNRIKIGFTTNLAKRMAMVPHEHVLATVPGTITDEHREHARFAHLRTTGEWFTDAPDLRAHIATLIPAPPSTPTR